MNQSGSSKNALDFFGFHGLSQRARKTNAEEKRQRGTNQIMVMRQTWSGQTSRSIGSRQIFLPPCAMVDEVHGMGGHHDDPPHHFCWKAPPNTIAMTEKESTNYTHYQVLGITSTASYEEIKVAYHKLARKSHPDKQQQESQNNTIDFKRIQLAWETLRNVEHRQVYDNDLQQEELRRKSRTHGALEITMNDLEEALDEESDETVLVYDCRCGEEVFIANWDNQKVTFVDCEGCCFVYKLCGKT